MLSSRSVGLHAPKSQFGTISSATRTALPRGHATQLHVCLLHLPRNSVSAASSHCTPSTVRGSCAPDASAAFKLPSLTTTPPSASKPRAVAATHLALRMCIACLGVGLLASGPAYARAPPHLTQEPLASSATSTPAPSSLDVAKWKILQAFTLPGLGKIKTILVVGVPFVLLGGALYRLATGDSWGSAVAKAYYILNKVPGEVIKENRQAANIVLNCIHVASICTFAVLVGVFTSEIAAGIKSMRSGNFPVPESNHTVILGWDDRQSITLLREVIESQRTQNDNKLQGPIVVLSDSTKKALIDEKLLNEFGDMFNKGIMTRQGCPAKPQDLARVGAGRASTVIWIPEHQGKGPHPADPSALLSATLTSLHSMRAPDSKPQKLVICEDGGSNTQESLIRTSAGRVAAQRLVTCNTTIARLTDVSELGIMAQVALQPQLSAVFEELCQQQQGEVRFYTTSAPELMDKTFKQARKAFPNAILVGLVDSVTGATKLTPTDNHKVGKQDRLLLLAADASKLTCMHWKASQQAAMDAVEEARTVDSEGASVSSGSARTPSKCKKEASSQEPLLSSHRHVHPPKNVVVLGYGGPIERIAASLEEFCGPGSKVTLVTPADSSVDKEARALQSQYDGRKVRGVHFKMVRGNLSSNAFLRKVGVAQADAVILGELGPAAGWLPADADAQVAASILQLQSLMEEEAALGSTKASTLHMRSTTSKNTKPPLSVVSCITNEKMKNVLQRLVTSTPCSTSAKEPRALMLNLIVAEELLAGMLTQVAADPLLGGVFEELLNESEGAEVYIRNPQEYGLSRGVPHTWEQVQDAVRHHGAVAIGYRNKQGGVHLGVENEAFNLQPSECLVVVSYT